MEQKQLACITQMAERERHLLMALHEHKVEKVQILQELDEVTIKLEMASQREQGLLAVMNVAALSGRTATNILTVSKRLNAKPFDQ